MHQFITVEILSAHYVFGPSLLIPPLWPRVPHRVTGEAYAVSWRKYNACNQQSAPALIFWSGCLHYSIVLWRGPRPAH